MRFISAHALRCVVAAIFEAAGCSQKESARIAESLVETNLTGHDSHGVIRVPRYIRALKQGEVKCDQSISIVTQNPVMAVVDGNYGFGQTIAPQAVRLGIEKAKAFGVSVIALRHAAHIGRIGEWAEMAAAADLISIHFVNVPGSVIVAPFNGVERRLSTNPVCIGVPVEGARPLILDFATSMVAEGKVLVALQGGKPLPEGSLIERDGRLTSDPQALYGDTDTTVRPDLRSGAGAIRAFGEHKGSGISFMCEILAGALSGGGAAGASYPCVTNAMLSMYLSQPLFGNRAAFMAEVKRFAHFFSSSLPAVPGTEVLMPGEPELRSREKRGREGIPLPDEVWEPIVQSGMNCGLARERIEELAAAVPV